jgi:ketosteroid isomerase-like protein
VYGRALTPRLSQRLRRRDAATIDLLFADFSRIRNGKIVAYRTYYDQTSLLTQLGLITEPPG